MRKEYIGNKFVQSIIYNTDLQPGDPSLDRKLNIIFLKQLNEYLKTSPAPQTIDAEIKERLFDIVSYVRFIKGLNSNIECNKELNEIVMQLNYCENKECTCFYFNQLNARALDSESTPRDYKFEVLKGFYPTIRRSICYDYKVLKSIIKNPEEYKKIENQYIVAMSTIHSIKGTYHEYPGLYEDDKIQENLAGTILKNEDFITSDKTFYMGNQHIKEKILKR